MNDQQHSSADALTEAQRKALETAVNVLNINWEHETANELWEAFTAPVSQPAAAPIAYDGLTEEFTDEVARLAGDAPGIREAVWAALENCNAIIAPQGNAAPSPADERAAFLEWFCADTPEKQREMDKESADDCLRRGHANDRLLGSWEGFQFGLKLARAASANETGAEGAEPMAIPAGWKLVPVAPTFEMCRAMEEAIDAGWKDSIVWARGIAAAPPPPAPASAPVGLTENARKLIEAAAECIAEAVNYEQDGFDSPPQPASQWDYNADQLAYALRALLKEENHAD
ncbi:hypothetical protein [Burkholderia multivorans]|uniref:hypothetical protein n=1 Tax=Burkholderia multivorans TaxID=87883 RepID=UPI003BFA04B3